MATHDHLPEDSENDEQAKASDEQSNQDENYFDDLAFEEESIIELAVEEL